MKIIDPLAQSFYVEPDSGFFVTSVDLYFQSKDEQLPVTVQLRPMQLGLPTQTVYPFSEVVIDPKNVNISQDASIPTKVTFKSPIYLLGGQFHSIVILSNSDQYNVWVSKLGEFDVTSGSADENRQILVAKQPLTGGLFKSQNASTWNESPYEDLKFTLYRAEFLSNSGNINFYNSDLSLGNSQVAVLQPNSLEMNSRRIRVGFNTIISDPNITLGNTIIQQNSTASGNYVGAAGSASGTLTLVNAGIGYTPNSGSLTYSNVSLQNITGSGKNATANITIENGVATAATINFGGTGYTVGDVLTVNQIGSETLGRNLRISVSSISGVNEFIISDVQGEYLIGPTNYIQYINNSGITTNLNGVSGNVLIANDGIEVENDGIHVKVNHKNHGMHFGQNIVTISSVTSDIKPTKLAVNYAQGATSDIILEDTSNFSTFENVSVGSTNPGYILIGNEIIAYEGISGNSLTGITREIDQTAAFSYSQGAVVYKYELNGISLRRINKDHSLEDVEISDLNDLDFYNIKIKLDQDGKTNSLPFGQVDRTVSNNFPKLYIKQSKSTGGSSITATQNIQYEIIRPNIQTQILNGTNITSNVRTVSGRSVDGNEVPFVDEGFQEINLNSNNYFENPRLICSKVNELDRLQNLPASKSFTVNLNLTTSNSYLSPVIDLDRVSMIFVSNRINNPIQDYITDDRVSNLKDDPSAFVYVTNPISLEIPATSIKVLLSAHINLYNDVRVLYSIQNDLKDTPVYSLFPGYSGLDDGTSDILVPKTDKISFDSREILFKDYEFTKDDLPSFKYFTIKIIGSSTNQSYPPRLRDLRVIALA